MPGLYCAQRAVSPGPCSRPGAAGRAGPGHRAREGPSRAAPGYPLSPAVPDLTPLPLPSHPHCLVCFLPVQKQEEKRKKNKSILVHGVMFAAFRGRQDRAGAGSAFQVSASFLPGQLTHRAALAPGCSCPSSNGFTAQSLFLTRGESTPCLPTRGTGRTGGEKRDLSPGQRCSQRGQPGRASRVWAQLAHIPCAGPQAARGSSRRAGLWLIRSEAISSFLPSPPAGGRGSQELLPFSFPPFSNGWSL